MKPFEIDHNNHESHFLDVRSGEVLAGKDTLEEYLDQVPDAEIYDVGELLRQPTKRLPQVETPKLDTEHWSRDDFITYGKWVMAITPPAPKGKMSITIGTLRNASKLGIGPGHYTVETVFENYSNFYKEIGAANVRLVGQYDEWSLEDYVRHIKSTWGDHPPSVQELNDFHKIDPNSPSYEHIWNRFRHIGGLDKLLELAGHIKVKFWDDKDYTQWGIDFMKANNGIVPTAYMMDFLSKKKLGPSSTTVRTNIGKINDFQESLIAEYGRRLRQEKDAEQRKIAAIEEDVRRKLLPQGLLTETKDTDEKIKPLLIEAYQVSKDGMDTAEILRRYARYKVISAVVPDMPEHTKITIAAGTVKQREFTAAIRKRKPIPHNEIEYAALTLGFFDDIWPPINDHSQLTINSEFDEYYAARELVR